jgi:dephospho-CoA kinase
VRFVDRIWRVDAPTEIRIDRVIKRNCVSRKAVEERIKAQAGEFANSDNTDIIINDGNTPVLPQLQKLLSQLTV